ncbi:MAG: TonB-dependent receptor, partial [Acidobacteriota bacterium]
RLVGNTGFLSNTFYFRYSDKYSSQGNSFPDQVDTIPPAPEDVPVREDILVVNEGEQELGWRGDFNFLAGENGTVAMGGRLTRVELDYDSTLDGPWINYVYDQDDYRPDPNQKFVVLLPEFIDNTYNKSAWRPAAYGEYSVALGNRVTLTPGLRLDYDGLNGQTLWSPRFSASFLAGSRTRLNFSTGVFYQYPRFLQIAASPANADLKSERSTQAVLGVSHYLSPDVRFSAEAYYQRLDDLVVIPDRTTNVASNGGDGYAYGIDLSLVKRLTSRWLGQVGYSYAVAERNDNLGEGEYPADFNRPHVFNIFMAYELTSNLQIGAKWKYMSGRPYDDFIIHADVFDDPSFLRYSKELTTNNTLRFPAFHTLNFRVDYRVAVSALDLVVFVDILDIYNHKNVNQFAFDPLTGESRAEGLEIFPTFGIKFEY